MIEPKKLSEIRPKQEQEGFAIKIQLEDENNLLFFKREQHRRDKRLTAEKTKAKHFADYFEKT